MSEVRIKNLSTVPCDLCKYYLLCVILHFYDAPCDSSARTPRRFGADFGFFNLSLAQILLPSVMFDISNTICDLGAAYRCLLDFLGAVGYNKCGKQSATRRNVYAG